MTTMDFTFPMASMDSETRCMNVVIFEDAVLERIEMFTVTLTLLTVGLGVTVGNDTTAVSIAGKAHDSGFSMSHDAL